MFLFLVLLLCITLFAAAFMLPLVFMFFDFFDFLDGLVDGAVDKKYNKQQNKTKQNKTK